MTLYVFTAEQTKEEIDLLAKKHGFKFFLFSSDLHGTAYAPGKKVNSYRVPVAIPNVFAEGKMNLSKAMNGFFLVGVKDLDIFDEKSRNAVEEDLKKQKGGS